MKTALAVAGLVLLSVRGAPAHRLDEYLQATILSLGKNRVQVEIRLTPGVAVLPFVLATIDTDGDGAISVPEQRAYAWRVIHDLSLEVDGQSLPLRLVSAKFPGIQEMKEGLGEIHLELAATMPGGRAQRALVFENHHQSRIAAYLVNCLAPEDAAIRVTAQQRNYDQSHYRLEYAQAGTGMDVGPEVLAAFAVLLLCLRLTWLWLKRPSPAKLIS